MKNNMKVWEGNESISYYNHSEINPLEKEVFSKYFKGEILDLGSGCGRLTNYFKTLGNVIGVEPVLEMVKVSKKKYKDILFVKGGIPDIPIKNSKEMFDSVYFNALDYLDEIDRENAIIELNHILKSGGILILNLHILGLFRPRFIIRNFIKGKWFNYRMERGNIGEFEIFYSTPEKHIEFIESLTNLKAIEMINRREKDNCPYFIFRKE